MYLVAAGEKAKFKGAGTLNGVNGYKFMISAIDGTPDKFRIKIWTESAAETIVYDNQFGATDDADPSTVLSGGEIVVHK